MKNNCKKGSALELKLPTGYYITETTLETDVDNAVIILSSKKQRKYTEAFREDGSPSARLVSHSLVCPLCGSTRPAYARFLNGCFSRGEAPRKRVSRDDISRWGSRQLSFFGGFGGILELNDVFTPKGSYKCPRCGSVSDRGRGERNVFIDYSGKRVRIACEVIGVDELLSLPWKNGKRMTLELPLYEIMTFNLKNGRTYVELGSADGANTVAKRDITSSPETAENGVINRLLAQNTIFSRKVKRIFKELSGDKELFSKHKATVERLSLLTRFFGFESSFYDAVPFSGTSYELDASFKKTEAKLRNPEKAKSYYESSSLPKVKSVRKIFFSKPGLLFYLKEAELLWDVVGEINRFCRLIGNDRIYLVFSAIRQKPGIEILLRDYKRVKGVSHLVNKILYEWEALEYYAGSYAVMSEYMRERDRRVWKKYGVFCNEEEAPAFSLPCRKPEEKIRDCEINGFSFGWLRNGREYLSASRELNNCLGFWSLEKYPVVLVRDSKKKAVAAIEVRGDTVFQARGYNNMPISLVRGLEDAYTAWINKYGLTFHEKEYDDDLDNEDLPF